MAEAGNNGAVSWNRYGYRFKNLGPNGDRRATYQRVTTIKSKLSTGDALVRWSARMAAEAARSAFMPLGEALADGRIDPKQAAIFLQNEAEYQRIENAHNQAREAAADFGTVFHSLVEAYAEGDQDCLGAVERELAYQIGGSWMRQANPRLKEMPSKAEIRDWVKDSADRPLILAAIDAAKDRLWPDVEAFVDWESRVKPTWILNECQVFSDEYGYAGSVDAFVEIGGIPLILDLKTSKGAYAEYGLQLAAYRHADWIGWPDGETSDIPDVDGGVILHVHNGQCRLLECPCGRAEFDAFLACHTLYWWTRESQDLKEYQPRLALQSPPDAFEEVFA